MVLWHTSSCCVHVQYIRNEQVLIDFFYRHVRCFYDLR